MKKWIEMLTEAMARSGKGYRRHTMRRTGEGEDRRSDKLREVTHILDGEVRVEYAEWLTPESKLQRGARLGILTVPHP